MNDDEYAIWAVFLWPGGHHHAAWRLQHSTGDDMHSFANYKQMAQAAERAKLDVCCWHLAYMVDLIGEVRSRW